MFLGGGGKCGRKIELMQVRITQDSSLDGPDDETGCRKETEIDEGADRERRRRLLLCAKAAGQGGGCVGRVGSGETRCGNGPMSTVQYWYSKYGVRLGHSDYVHGAIRCAADLQRCWASGSFGDAACWCFLAGASLLLRCAAFGAAGWPTTSTERNSRTGWALRRSSGRWS